MQLILASASPRRREILTHLGCAPRIVLAETDEQSNETDGARLVELLSLRKGRAVLDKLTAAGDLPPDGVIVAADTVVVSPEGKILGKPRDAADARRMLRALSGQTHQVISGIAVLTQHRTAVTHEVTQVSFAPLSDNLIDRYIASGEPMDKAGAYGIQDTAALWIDGIHGDYFSVVGLPVHRLEQLLNHEFGLSLWG